MRPEPLDPSAYKFRPIATEAELESLGSWSPDGKSIAYLKAVQGKRQLMLRSLDATSPVQLTKLPNGVSQGAAPFFSPSGELVYFIARDGVWSVAVVGGEPRPVLKVPMFAAALSPDGQTLAFWRQHEEAGKEYCTVWISSPPGAPPRKYEPAPFQSTSCYIPNFLSYSPDGSQIALTTYTKVGEASVWILPWPDGTKARPRRAFSSYLFRSPSSLGWMPDSRSFCLVKDGNLWLGDPAAGKLQRLTVSPVGQFREPSVSPGGDALLFTAMLNDMDIVEIPLDGTSPRPLLATARNEAWPSMSAAGDQMAFVTDRTGEYEIWLRNPQAGWERPVVRQKDFPQDPGQLFVAASLSPDGARVAYLRHSKLWVSPVSGGRASQAVGGDESQDSAASWSPDSTSLTYIATSGGKLHLAVTRIGSQEPQFLVPGTANQCVSPPVWSPDGRWIACGSLEDQNRLLLFSPDGGQRRTVPSPAAVTPQRSVMVWSRDAQTIYLASSAELKARLDAIDIRTGTSRRIAEYAGEIVFGSRTAFTNTASLSRDGKSFVTTILHTREDLWVLEGFPQSRRRWF